MAALTSGRLTPSSRLRVRQHLPSLAAQGVPVREFAPWLDKHTPLPGPGTALLEAGAPKRAVTAAWAAAKLACRVPGLAAALGARAVWQERLLLPGRYTLEGLIRKPVVFDVDDAIWLLPPHGEEAVARAARRAAAVVAGNALLAEHLSRFNRQVHIIPTAIDTDLHQAVDRSGLDRPFTLGWTGTAVNLPYLEALEPSLQRAFAAVPGLRLLVVADAAPSFPGLPADRVAFRRWTPEVEAAALHDMDAGLMPMPDTPWTRGKCAFKMLLCMASGLPVAASPVGVVPSMVEPGVHGFLPEGAAAWTEALVLLAQDRERAARMGVQGRALVDSRYSVRRVSAELAAVFRPFL